MGYTWVFEASWNYILQQSIIPYLANIAYNLFSLFDAKKNKQTKNRQSLWLH
jgi:hypothetical protein